MTITKRTYFTMNEAGIDITSLVPNVAEVTRLTDLIKTRYADNWVTYTDTEIRYAVDEVEAVPNEAKVNQWKNRFKYIYETTSEKYFKLIKMYKDNENNLLNKIGSTVSNRFNDTPQNANSGDTDEFTTTVSKTITEVDPGEVINRIENIRKNYKMIYDLWVNEFDNLFGESTLI